MSFAEKDDFQRISHKLQAGDRVIPLYDTFESQEEALNAIKKDEVIKVV